MNDLDLIVVRKVLRGVAVSGDDGAIDFDGNPSLTEAEIIDQFRDGEPVAQDLRLTVEDDVHARKIVAEPNLYNLGGVW